MRLPRVVAPGREPAADERQVLVSGLRPPPVNVRRRQAEEFGVEVRRPDRTEVLSERASNAPARVPSLAWQAALLLTPDEFPRGDRLGDRSGLNHGVEGVLDDSTRFNTCLSNAAAASLRSRSLVASLSRAPASRGDTSRVVRPVAATRPAATRAAVGMSIMGCPSYGRCSGASVPLFTPAIGV